MGETEVVDKISHMTDLLMGTGIASEVLLERSDGEICSIRLGKISGSLTLSLNIPKILSAGEERSLE